jgi:hypothetical protein
MKPHRRATTALTGIALAAGLLAAAAPTLASAGGRTAHLGHVVTLRASGTGQVVLARTVSVRAAAAGRQIPAHGWNRGPLGIDGKAAGSTLPVRRAAGVKARPAGPATRLSGPNTGRVAKAAIPAIPAPFKVNANFNGVAQSGSNCGGCQPPDVNAAVSPTQIAEAVNLRLQVYSTSGKSLCGVSLNTLAGTTGPLSDPRIMWDTVHKRFFMDFIPVPTADTDTPAEYLLATKTASACGSWFVYRMTFSGGAFPAGSLLDYPYLGQDNSTSTTYSFGGAILSSTNNFCCSSNSFGTYEGSTAFAIPKFPVYNGQGFSFRAFTVVFSTAPVTPAGVPMKTAVNTYFLAGVPGSGYDLYVMTHSSDPGSTTLNLQAAISAPWNRPSRRVNQPGTTQTLDPLDGRIVWSPARAGPWVYFTHGVDRSGFPSVQYGAVNLKANTVQTAAASHSATSDDFNPSLGLFPTGTNTVRIWLNWAYTDSPNGVPTTDVVNGVLPGTGLPNLAGTDFQLIKGFTTTSNSRFGDFSSVQVDPVATSSTCSLGKTAVLAQQYFGSNGQWQTRIARTSFC